MWYTLVTNILEVIMKYQSLSIKLTKEQRTHFEGLVRKGEGKAREIRKASILLAVDEAEGRKRTKDVVVAAILNTTSQTVCQTKKDFLNSQKPEMTIKRKKRKTPPVPAKITGDVEAHIIALACSTPPAGYGKWTLRLIADRMIELEYIDTISHTSVGKTLKKTNITLI
jgi:hypothetical protein